MLLDDLAMIPVGLFAGSFAMQTHVSYVGLVSGLSLFAADRRVPRDSVRRRAVGSLRPCGTRRPRRDRGRSFRPLGAAGDRSVRAHARQHDDPLGLLHRAPRATVGPREGLDLLLRQLDPWRLLTESLSADIQPGDVEGSLVAGSLLVAVWAAATFVAWRLRLRTVLALDAVIGVALALGTLSAARIFGIRFYYLLLWAWGLAALMLFAIHGQW